MKLIKRFIKDERGLAASEYALLLALICIALITAIGALSGKIVDAFQGVANIIDTTPPT